MSYQKLSQDKNLHQKLHLHRENVSQLLYHGEGAHLFPASGPLLLSRRTLGGPWASIMALEVKQWELVC